MTRTILLIFTACLLTNAGCNPPPTASPTDTENPGAVTIDDVKRDAANSLETTATYSQQEKDKLMKDLNGQLAAMDKKIEELRTKGAALASDAKANWEVKMSELDIRRKAAHAKLVEIENSTAQAWDEVAKGAQSAWEDLKKAFQSAADEF